MIKYKKYKIKFFNVKKIKTRVFSSETSKVKNEALRVVKSFKNTFLNTFDWLYIYKYNFSNEETFIIIKFFYSLYLFFDIKLTTKLKNMI